MERKHNFYAGPAVLPVEVLEEVQKDLVNYQGCGVSVMEMSHRSKDFQAIIDDGMATLKKLMGIGDNFEVLFLQGGASTQFLMVPMNLCADGKVANYIDTGAWATKAIKEAEKAGKKVHIAATSKDKDFTYIPKEFKLSENPAYLHITTNNTIRGSEYHHIPEVPADVPLIADMSSNFLSKPMDFNKFSLIYAGAQKNIGPAGCTVVIIRKDLIEKLNTGTSCAAGLPTMLSYKTHLDKGSLFNTPPSFTIYVISRVLAWIERNGGLEGIKKINEEKGAELYGVFDSSDFYNGTVVKEDRSLMNVPFRLANTDLEPKFIEEATSKGMLGLKGHRSVGGVRASIYNACPLASVKALCDFMKEFEKNNK